MIRPKEHSSLGFTLIELSIVLVIIGLITGGVLVGQDLIRAAGIRATIKQVESFNSAVNTFRGKYGYLPGDMPPNIASSYGFFAFAGANAGTAGYGDGNGFVDTGIVACEQESLVFWRHLSDAKLIEGAYGQTTGSNGIDPNSGQVLNTVSGGNISQFLPVPKISNSAFFVAQNFFSTGTIVILPSNVFALYPVAQLRSAGGCQTTVGGIKSIDAHNIDAKIDDGLPYNGNVIGTGDWHTCTLGANTNDPNSTYNLDSNNGAETPDCTMYFKFQ